MVLHDKVGLSCRIRSTTGDITGASQGVITGCITDGITGLHRISGGVGQEGGIWSICKTRQLEYYSDKKTQLKGVSLSGLRYAVFAGDEKTLTLSEKGSRSRDLQDVHS